jgi:hypothetical protein
MKTLEEKISYEAKEWAKVLTECPNLKGDADYNSTEHLEKLIVRMMQEGACLAKNHIKSCIDNE